MAGRPLALFRALLLAIWHDVSDVRLAEALNDHASFRRFCGFSTYGPTPERTAFVHFRGEPVRLGLDRARFAAVTRQLDRCGVSTAVEFQDRCLVPGYDNGLWVLPHLPCCRWGSGSNGTETAFQLSSSTIVGSRSGRAY